MRHLVFDTETNALINNSSRPIEKQPQVLEVFCLVLNAAMEEVETLHQYFNPGKPISKEITKITGITDETVKDAPRFMNAFGRFKRIIESCDVVVAHILSYDIGVTDFEFARIGQTVKWPERKVCTVEATEYMKGYRLNLSGLHMELFGETFDGAHRAENDVRALARCYVELVKRGEV